MKTKFLLLLIPSVLLQVGSMFKDKDTNSTGKDDATGNILNALAPAISALANENESAFKKALIIVRDTINTYLGVDSELRVVK